MTNDQIISYVVAAASIATAIGVILRKFKRDPGQKEKDEAALKLQEVAKADAILDVATNTVELVSTALKAELARIQTQLAEEREERKREQAELRALHAEQIALERAQTQTLKQEISEVNRDVETLRLALREAQQEATKWKQAYEAEIAKNGHTPRDTEKK